MMNYPIVIHKDRGSDYAPRLARRVGVCSPGGHVDAATVCGSSLLQCGLPLI